MARVKKGLLSKKVVGRGGGAPGHYSKDYNAKQEEAIGKKAKKPMPKYNRKSLISELEGKKSISASKTRERYRSKKK